MFLTIEVSGLIVAVGLMAVILWIVALWLVVQWSSQFSPTSRSPNRIGTDRQRQD